MRGQAGLRSSKTAQVDDALDAGLPRHIVCEPGLLLDVLQNLGGNAVKFTDHGRISLTAEVVGHDAEGQALIELRVKDTGIGIPLEKQARIFERFYRVDPARSRETGGTGLGLSIVKHVASNHGGDVKVWSSPNVGSSFALRLPIYTPNGGVTQ